MKKSIFIKFISLMLVLLLILPFAVSCAKGEGEADESESAKVENTQKNEKTEATKDAGAEEAGLTLNEEGTAYTFSPTEAQRKLETVVIPNEYNGIPVTNIMSKAFYDCKTLKSITIPENVTYIGQAAFYGCTALTEINYNAIDCEGVIDSNHIVGTYIFGHCGMESDGVVVTIGNKVKRIPEGLFCFSMLEGYTGGSTPNNNITELLFEDGSACEEIGEKAFYECNSLKKVGIPKSMKKLGGLAFQMCNNIDEVHIEDIAVWCAMELTPTSNPLCGAKLYMNGTQVTELVIPASVTKINAEVFSSVDGLTKVSFAENSTLESIGENAFEACTALTHVEIPSSVKTIGKNAFSSCAALRNATFGETSGWWYAQGRVNSQMPTSVFQSESSAAKALRETYANYVWSNP